MKKPKFIEIQNCQTLQSIIEEAKKLGVTDLSKIIIDVEASIESIPYCGENHHYASCEIKLKKVK